MPIGGIFQLGSDVIEVGISGNNLIFRDVSTGLVTNLAGLKFDYNGVLKEFPDLKDDEDWKKKAMERLQEHMKKIDKEFDKLDYVKSELVKFGWIPKYYQQEGFRSKSW